MKTNAKIIVAINILLVCVIVVGYFLMQNKLVEANNEIICIQEAQKFYDAWKKDKKYAKDGERYFLTDSPIYEECFTDYRNDDLCLSYNKIRFFDFKSEYSKEYNACLASIAYSEERFPETLLNVNINSDPYTYYNYFFDVDSGETIAYYIVIETMNYDRSKSYYDRDKYDPSRHERELIFNFNNENYYSHFVGSSDNETVLRDEHSRKLYQDWEAKYMPKNFDKSNKQN